MSCKSLGSPQHQPRRWVGNGQCCPPCAAPGHCIPVQLTPVQLTPVQLTPCTGTSHTSTSHTGTSHTAQTPPASDGAFHLSPRLPRRVLIYIKASGKLNCLQSTVCAAVLFLLWENTTLPRRHGCAILLSFPCNACSKCRRRPRAPACLPPSG